MASSPEQILKEVLIRYDSQGQGGATQVMSDLSKGAGKLQSDVNGVSQSLEEFAVAFGAATGIKKGLSTFLDINKALVQSSAQFSKYGIGIGRVEKQMESLSKKVGITKMASLELFSLYEKGFPIISIKQFGALMDNIVKVTGASVSAMKEYQGLLGQLSSQFPAINASLVRLNETDKSRLSSMREALVLTGKMDLATAKQLGDRKSVV